MDDEGQLDSDKSVQTGSQISSKILEELSDVTFHFRNDSEDSDANMSEGFDLTFLNSWSQSETFENSSNFEPTRDSMDVCDNFPSNHRNSTGQLHQRDWV